MKHRKRGSNAFGRGAVCCVVAVLALPGRVEGQASAAERLSVHGHLSQAFAMTDRYQYAGIPSRGTMDYRTAALQFRFDATDRDAMVLQFSHERFGRSPIAASEPLVDLDWAFYERRLGDATRLRVGKVVMPIGIYNEIRDVGVLLPLYRPPALVYSERMYAVEALSGVTVDRRLGLGGAWDLTADAFFGEWEYLQLDYETMARASNGLGTQLWLSTPLPGLRIGGSALGYTVSNQLGMPEDHEERMHGFGAALDGTFDGGFVRTELRHTRFEIGTAEAYYAELGVHLGGGFTVVAQAEYADWSMDFTELFPPGMPFPLVFDGNIARNHAVALRWSPFPSMAVKLEGHRHRGYLTEDPVLFLLTDAPARFNYGILSVSTSF